MRAQARFKRSFEVCGRAFAASCVGPSNGTYSLRLDKARACRRPFPLGPVPTKARSRLGLPYRRACSSRDGVSQLMAQDGSQHVLHVVPGVVIV